MTGITAHFQTRHAVLFCFAAIASIVVKVSLASLGYNYDFASYVIVADAVRHGHVVYAATERYNYGPIWAYALAGMRTLQMVAFPNGGERMFHVVVALALAYVDLLIALWLLKRHGLAAALLMLCNPVSWLITGFHSQFDNVAVYLGLLASGYVLTDPDTRTSNRAFLLGTVLLGVSLITKHILVFFPLWCFMRSDLTWSRKFMLLFIPAGLFASSFLPFLGDPAARAGILHNVIHYEAYRFTGFLPHVLGLFVSVESLDHALSWIPIFGGFKFIWIVSLCWAGYGLRRVPAAHALPCYLMAMVVLSGQVVDQYLAIPLVACAIFFRSSLIWLYLGVTSIYLLGSDANIGIVEGLEYLGDWPKAIGMQAWWSLDLLFAFLMVYLWRMRRRADA